MLHNVQILNGNVFNLLVSYSKERGKILNKMNKNMADFFSYEDLDEFENAAGNIKCFMPPYIKNIHDKLMDCMIERGTSHLIKSSKPIYVQDKNFYVKPAKLYLDNCFGFFDDFCILATLLKIQTSEDFLLFN